MTGGQFWLVGRVARHSRVVAWVACTETLPVTIGCRVFFGAAIWRLLPGSGSEKRPPAPRSTMCRRASWTPDDEDRGRLATRRLIVADSARFNRAELLPFFPALAAIGTGVYLLPGTALALGCSFPRSRRCRGMRGVRRVTCRIERRNKKTPMRVRSHRSL